MSDIPDANSFPRETRGGTPATRGEAVNFNGRWTEHDRRVVSEELDRIRDRTSYLWRTASNSYIRATDAGGRALMYVEAGYLWWHDGRVEAIPAGAVADGEGWLLPLSTRQETGSRRGPHEEESAPICQTCFSYALSKTGLCPNCDE